MSTGKLILHRKKNLNGALVYVNLYIDGQEVEPIANGERREFNLTTGFHIIKVQQYLKAGEIKIDIKENQTLFFEFKPTPWVILSFIAPILAVMLVYFLHLSKIVGSLIIAAGVLLIIYYLTMGRKKYYIFKLKATVS